MQLVCSYRATVASAGRTGKDGRTIKTANIGRRPAKPTKLIAELKSLIDQSGISPKLQSDLEELSEAQQLVVFEHVKAGERLPVRELLYGLLLPSGNDAAVALAEHVGPRLHDGEPSKEDAVRLLQGNQVAITAAREARWSAQDVKTRKERTLFDP